MKKTNKLLLLISLVIIIALSVLVLVSCDNESVNGKKLVLELNENGNGYIVSGVTSKKLTKVILPETYNGLPVVSIDNGAFSN